MTKAPKGGTWNTRAPTTTGRRPRRTATGSRPATAAAAPPRRGATGPTSSSPSRRDADGTATDGIPAASRRWPTPPTSTSGWSRSWNSGWPAAAAIGTSPSAPCSLRSLPASWSTAPPGAWRRASRRWRTICGGADITLASRATARTSRAVQRPSQRPVPLRRKTWPSRWRRSRQWPRPRFGRPPRRRRRSTFVLRGCIPTSRVRRIASFRCSTLENLPPCRNRHPAMAAATTIPCRPSTRNGSTPSAPWTSATMPASLPSGSATTPARRRPAAACRHQSQ
mmetsp:Transcript_31240/g.91510  ORF Transcript_31240/g.91510 Transcript_31240/m.91510 type:complete len:281 (+) Transcript_31240:222-1064(+)